MPPKIAFCITCKNRTQHVKQTLPRNLADNSTYENAVFVILDYGSEDDLQEYLITHHRSEIESGRVVIYRLQNAGNFKMAHAKNCAHRCGLLEGAEILCGLDADNYTGQHFASYIAHQFSVYGKQSFLGAGKIVPGVTPRGISGRIAVTSQAFLNAGGYDERFETWGPDDKDFNCRLRRLGYQWQGIDNQYLNCVLHNDKIRFREYKHARCSVESYEEEPLESATTRVANFGHFGEGVVFRNGWPYPITLGPVPTRIFGIGMHKTGSTSLHHALTTLGFDSAHWPSAHWAKAVWNEMKEQGRSLTVERHYAACDLPIAPLYRELDASLPGSKFILTLRDEESWLRSVKNHWDPAYNPWRNAWDGDPFTHKIHKEIYGQKGFNETIFLERFRRHNAEVLDYFRDRPSDLLILHLEDKNPWASLCAFLNKRIPTTPYPTSNRST